MVRAGCEERAVTLAGVVVVTVVVAPAVVQCAQNERFRPVRWRGGLAGRRLRGLSDQRLGRHRGGVSPGRTRLRRVGRASLDRWPHRRRSHGIAALSRIPHHSPPSEAHHRPHGLVAPALLRLALAHRRDRHRSDGQAQRAEGRRTAATRAPGRRAAPLARRTPGSSRRRSRVPALPRRTPCSNCSTAAACA